MAIKIEDPYVRLPYELQDAAAYMKADYIAKKQAAEAAKRAAKGGAPADLSKDVGADTGGVGGSFSGGGGSFSGGGNIYAAALDSVTPQETTEQPATAFNLSFDYNPYQQGKQWQHSAPYNRTYQELLDYGPFSYDYSTDPLYQVYQKEYTREGQRAQQDALAQLSARTGGLASSYAGGASTQAYLNYMQQLANKIPELRQQAYNEYQQGFNQLLQKHGITQQNDQFDYGVYDDAQSRDYQQYLDDLNFRYGMTQDEYNKLLAAAGKMEQYGDLSGYDKLWGTDLQALYDAQKAASAAKGGGSYRLTTGGDNGNGNLIDYTHGNGLGWSLYNASEGNPALASEYLLDNWENMTFSARSMLLRNMGFNYEEANDLANRLGNLTGAQFSAWLASNAPSSTAQEEQNTEDTTDASSGNIDMASVRALGYGDLTPDELAELVAGQAIYMHTRPDGTIYFTKAGKGR